MNQSRSEYVVAIIWREKQSQRYFCDRDRLHDDYIDRSTLEEAEQIAADLRAHHDPTAIRLG